jgi:hypothetical protein
VSAAAQTTPTPALFAVEYLDRSAHVRFMVGNRNRVARSVRKCHSSDCEAVTSCEYGCVLVLMQVL